MAYPVELGEEYELEIVETTPNGEGVGKIKGFPVFVKNAPLGANVKVRVTKLEGGCADAQIAT
ncbi:MAG: TRAM domain-containing protein [Candidatus Bathyarchaeota archaeon]|nr:TRAM domain-containing protein [Candidatus Bathyarchaeota archaeon]